MSVLTMDLSFSESVQLITYLFENKLSLNINYVKNIITIFSKDDHLQVKYRYPLILNLNEDIIKDKNLLNKYIALYPPFLMILIQTGQAALGFFKDGEIIKHKVIRKYMIRKKQGMSQLKYLKTKGKSRAGSRVRLSNAVLFFEEINTRLNDWMHIVPAESIIYSCTPLLWGMLYQSKILPPFKKKDERLKKLPLSTGIPNFKIIKKTSAFCKKGYIEIMPDCSKDLRNLLESFFRSQKPGI